MHIYNMRNEIIEIAIELEMEVQNIHQVESDT